MRAEILKPTIENLAFAGERLRDGALVAIPTETVYGLAGAAFRTESLASIFDTKERPTFDPLIIHIGFATRGLTPLQDLGLVKIDDMSAIARERAESLIGKFWPGPLTLVLPKQPGVPDLATSGLATVALRMPRHSIAQALIAAAGTPLAAPSANRFGRISPTTAQAVADELGDRIDWIIDGGACDVGVESTVVSIALDGETRLLRPGGISSEEIEKILGITLKRPQIGSQIQDMAQVSPGLLESHYAPSVPLRLIAEPGLHASLQGWDPKTKLGLLLMSGPITNRLLSLKKQIENAVGTRIEENQFVARCLSETGDLTEMARNLFRALRELDQSGASLILAEPSPTDLGIGHAISDRLRRASAR